LPASSLSGGAEYKLKKKKKENRIERRKKE